VFVFLLLLSDLRVFQQVTLVGSVVAFLDCLLSKSIDLAIMSAGTPDANRQIKQMVNFIMQEAHEKVNEIRIKTDHDFNLEKQSLVHNGKLRVQEEYEQKHKDLEVQARVARSAAVGKSRVEKMKARDQLLEDLRKETLEKLATFCKGSEYPNFLKKLIVQGLIKIEEPEVQIQARAEDKAIVTRVLPEAINEFRTLMSAAGHTVNPKVTVSNNAIPSKSWYSSTSFALLSILFSNFW